MTCKSALALNCVIVLTVREYVVCQVEIKLADGHIDVVGIDTQTGVKAGRSLFQPLPVSGLERDSFEENDHHQVQPPNLKVAVEMRKCFK